MVSNDKGVNIRKWRKCDCGLEISRHKTSLAYSYLRIIFNASTAPWAETEIIINYVHYPSPKKRGTDTTTITKVSEVAFHSPIIPWERLKYRSIKEIQFWMSGDCPYNVLCASFLVFHRPFIPFILVFLNQHWNKYYLEEIENWNTKFCNVPTINSILKLRNIISNRVKKLF